MLLTFPVDIRVLDALVDGRNTALNLSQEMGYTRSYINQRFAQLADYRLVEKVGPAENSGLYQLTPRGAAVRDFGKAGYSKGPEFEERVDERAADFEIVPQQVIDHAADAE